MGIADEIHSRHNRIHANVRVVTFPFGKSSPSLLEALWPSALPIHKAGAAILFVFIIAALAQWGRFYLPNNPLPISLQTFGVLLAGGLLGWRWGTASLVIYYLAGLLGAPIFVSGSGGWDYTVYGVSGGYLLGFILSAWTVGWLTQRGWSGSRSLWATLIGSFVVYIPGLLWLTIFDFGWPAEGRLFSEALYPFIAGDLLKALAASLTMGGLWRIAIKRNKHRLV